MPSTQDYTDYVSDRVFMQGYAAYQQKYAQQIRESDRVTMDLVRPALEKAQQRGQTPRLLDVGCSTGNFLGHCHRAFPYVECHGADMVESILEDNRRRPDLKGIEFHRWDLLRIDEDSQYDAITSNAVLFIFDTDQFARACHNLSRALRPGGRLVAFEFYHPYQQELAIEERSSTHPDGMMLHFRSMENTERILKAAGFQRVDFQPFQIPIDLPHPADPADITTHTRQLADQSRLLFRGALCQPWCHLIATL